MKNTYQIIWIFFYCWIIPQAVSAQAFLNTPISGTYGKDFIIVNYVDWEQGNEILDYRCGNKTYDGHEGTDFVIRNFAVMDSGVDVIAAADGVITFVEDNLFDREKQSVISKGFGNFIAIAHSNGYYSYYAHLKQNSARVSIGDSVKAGDVIGQVGSSGNSTDPHLHFELWYDSLYVVEPFAGECGNISSLWLNELNYDTDFQIWSSSLCGFIPDLDTLREEPNRVSNFSAEVDESITYWNIIYGLKKDDSLVLKWFTPEGIEWYQYAYTAPKDYWYFYYWSYIDVPSTQNSGDWKVVLYRNNHPADTLFFTVQDANSIENINNFTECTLFPNPTDEEYVYIKIDKPITNDFRIEVTNYLGQTVFTKSFSNMHDTDNKIKLQLNELQSGIYFVNIRNQLEVINMKLIKE